jgi:hypothetical protein
MKKYSEKFIHEYSKLKTAKVGFEFEFYMNELSFYKTLELLNKELSPVKVHGFRQYHSGFTPDSKNFKIEPDLSGGSNMVELVTGPLEYNDAKYYLTKILKFIQNYGYTNEKCSIHYNISFTDKDSDLRDLNVLKLILNTNEDEIYRYYPSRKGNIYAKSIKRIVPFKQYDFFNIPIQSVSNSMRLPDDKYFGINFLHINNEKSSQRIEYRYIGGKDYEMNIGNVVYFLDRFIIDVWNSVDAQFNESDAQKLEEYLESNIDKWKTFSKYDTFIIEYPSIQLQIDQNFNYDYVNSYFPRLYNKLFDLIESTDDLKDCIVNFVATTQTMEVVDANVKSNFTLKGYEFINCQINSGIFDNCHFVACEMNNLQVSKSKIDDSDVSGSKILSCRVENSSLKNCFFMNGFLNSDMEGGVFRSGELGPYATISPETKIVKTNDNFFDTKFDEDDDKGDKEGIIDYKGFKK